MSNETEQFYEVEIDITEKMKKAMMKRGATQEDVDELFCGRRLMAGVDCYRRDPDAGNDLYLYKSYCYEKRG